MAFEKKTFAPEVIANARELYENTQTPVDEIAASLGITRRTLVSRIIEWGWTARKTAKAAKPERNIRMRATRGTKSKGASLSRKGLKRANSKRTNSNLGKASPKRAATFGENQPRRKHPAVGAKALAVRVQRVVERELDAIDQILGAIGAADAAEAERSARTLASLARALKEVMRLAAPDEPADADDDDPVPRDLDEFRRELARRIEALGAGGAAETSGDGG